MSSNLDQQAIIYFKNKQLNYRAVAIWAIVSCFTCFQFCTQIVAGPMTRELMEEFSLNAVSISYVISSFFYVYLIMQIPAGLMLDRLSSRYILSFTCAVCAIGVMLMSFATNVYWFVFGRIVCGFGSAFGFIGAMCMIKNYIPFRYIALFIGLTEMVGFFMTAIFEHIISYYLPIVGFQNILFDLGLVGIFIAFSIYLILSPRFTPQSFIVDDTTSTTEQSTGYSDIISLLTNKQMWYLGFVGFCFFSIVTSFSALWGVPSLVNIHDLSLQDSTQIISCIFLGIAVGGPVMGYINSKLSLAWQKKIILWSGIVCSCLVLIFINIKLESILLFYLLFFLLGFFCCSYLTCFSLASQIVPAKLNGVCMGLINMITMASALIMQPVMGYLVALHGPIDYINDAPIYAIDGYQRACIALIVLFVLASFTSRKLELK